MKRKPIHIDWDELEAAFENRNADLTYYLDTVTGQVGLEGEGEDAHFDDDAEMENAVEVVGASRNETTRLVVVTYSDDDELDWMDDFLAGEKDMSAELRAVLDGFIAGVNADGFRDELRHHAEVRDRWFLFRSDRVHDVMREWLDEYGLVAALPPPWGAA